MAYPDFSNGIELLKAIDNFSHQKIQNRDTLHLLFDICLINNQFKLLEQLSFTAKYVNGLARVLSSAHGNSDYKNIESIKKDYYDNIVKASDQLKQMIAFMDEQSRNEFTEMYLALKGESFAKLLSLFDDLEWIKRYLNAVKRNEIK